MRRPVIAANWKMYKTHTEAQLFIEGLRNRLQPKDYEKVEIVVCPPFTSLRTVQTTIDGDDLEIALGAQDVHWEEEGAFTGEVSPLMLEKLKVRFVIVGHSERRQFFGETDETVNKKVKSAVAHNLTPILCVGESKEEREAETTEERVGSQVQRALSGIKQEQVASLVIAYEPIWAIGTGLTASKEDAQQTIAFIRETVEARFPGAGPKVRIQYGGSVKPGNIAELMQQPDIDGALVGGASLDPEDFSLIVRYENKVGDK